jgi:hypothetical protein
MQILRLDAPIHRHQGRDVVVADDPEREGHAEPDLVPLSAFSVNSSCGELATDPKERGATSVCKLVQRREKALSAFAVNSSASELATDPKLPEQDSNYKQSC